MQNVLVNGTGRLGSAVVARKNAVRLAFLFVAIGAVLWATTSSSSAQAQSITSSYTGSQAKTYTTTFPLTENPISEGGHWVGGSAAGGNLWGDVQTAGGRAFGVSQPTTFGDPTAILTGTWRPNQTASGVVSVPVAPTGPCCHEVEVRLRMTISPNSITGYEIFCSVMPGVPYIQIARWNGGNGNYLILKGGNSYCANGDVLTATVTGTNPVTITAYKNGVQVVQGIDTGSGGFGPWTSGNPGIGFFIANDTNWSSFGFASFTATDSWMHIQTTSKNSAASTNTLRFAANTTAGNLLIAAVSWTGGFAFSSIRDSQGNHWTQIGSEQSLSGPGVKSRLYYARNIIGGADTLTTTLSGVPAFHELYIHEYSGLDQTNPLEQFSVHTGSGSSFTSNPVTTGSSNALLYGIEIDSATGSASAGWTVRSSLDGNVAADRNAATPGSYAFTGTSSGSSLAWIAAFKGAP